MLQDGRPVPRVTVGELVGFVARTYPAPMPVAEALELAGITELAGRRVDKLSGGQTQRVRFAVALVGNPALIVLDEPTAALDVEARYAFWDSMRAYARRGHTVLFSTHYLEEADANADRIVVIDRGRIVADGSGEQLKRSAGGNLVAFDLAGRSTEGLTLLPGVVSVEIRGDRARLRTEDSDATVIALAGMGAIRGLEVAPASLDDAFLALTGSRVHRVRRVPRVFWRGCDGGGWCGVGVPAARSAADAARPGFVVGGVVMPVMMYLLFTNLGDGDDSGWKTASMVGMAAYGAMGSALNTGAGVAEDKSHRLAAAVADHADVSAPGRDRPGADRRGDGAARDRRGAGGGRARQRRTAGRVEVGGDRAAAVAGLDPVHAARSRQRLPADRADHGRREHGLQPGARGRRRPVVPARASSRTGCASLSAYTPDEPVRAARHGGRRRACAALGDGTGADRWLLAFGSYAVTAYRRTARTV